MDYVPCLLTLTSSEKWRSPLFGATGNFNHQILPYGILFLTFININVFYSLSFKFSRKLVKTMAFSFNWIKITWDMVNESHWFFWQVITKNTIFNHTILFITLFNLSIGDNWFFIIFIMKSTTFLHIACIGMVPSMVILMLISKFNHICIAMITLGVINYRKFSYRCILCIWMIMSTIFLNTLYTCRIGMIQ